MNRRKYPRFGLQFPVSFFGPRVNGTGLALNVSEEGCLIESDHCPNEGDYVEVSLNLPDQDVALRIESAAVRWVTGRTFGLQFLFMSTAVLDRLQAFIGGLATAEVESEPCSPEPTAPATVDRRQEPRFEVRYRSSFASGKMLGGEGTVTDLSSRGCRVSADAPVPAKTVLEMHLHLEDAAEPIKIPEAVVRWSEGNDFGLEFREMDPKSFDRLRRVINGLASA